MFHITRLDGYFTNTVQAVTFYRGSRTPKAYFRPSLASMERLFRVITHRRLYGYLRLHPNVTGWKIDLVPNAHAEGG